MKNVFKPLAKGILNSSELTLKILGSGTTTLIIPNYEMEDMTKIVKSHEDSGLLLKGVSKTIQNEAKDKKKDFLVCYYVSTLGVSLLGNILAGKEMKRAGEGFIRAGCGSSIKNKSFSYNFIL